MNRPDTPRRLGAVYYIETGNPLPNFLAEKPATSDKEEFFKGNWREAWPRDFEPYVATHAKKEEK